MAMAPAAEKAAYEAKAGHPVHDFYWFTDLYKQMPFGNPAYHELFRLLEEHRVPLLFHCTCGKDRTGIAAMLVLLALGVSREDAIADYMLTNVYRKAIIDKFMQDKPADQYDLFGGCRTWSQNIEAPEAAIWYNGYCHLGERKG